MAITVSTSQAREALTHVLRAKLTPMLVGSPGIGKSALVHDIAEEYNLKVIDVRLAQCDPVDLLGMPSIDQEAKKASYLPMSVLPIEGDEVPEGYSGWLIFLDEFNAADPGVQKAAYKLILDRMMGEFPIHEKALMVCAGNLATDGALVEELTTALQSRLIHFELQANYEEWLDWAMRNGIDHRITSFIKFKPGMLNTFKPDHSDKTYACARTWDFANRLLKTLDIASPVAIPVLAGTLSEGVAREFVAFTRIYQDLHTIDDILARPDKLSVPDEPSVLFAMTGSIAHHANEDNISQLMVYLKRFPVEFQMLCLKEIIRRDISLLQHPELNEWVTANAAKLY